MGFRFQRRVNLNGGWGLNASSSGVSPSLRTRHGSIGAKGFSIRSGIPGLSFRQSRGKNSGVAIAIAALIVGIVVVAVQLLIYLIPLIWQCVAWIALTTYDLVKYGVHKFHARRAEPRG